jgi:2-polyprenyl-3-methyl-5-hydroxy-6-metoxy-1,4-benzoquinol methylase
VSEIPAVSSFDSTDGSSNANLVDSGQWNSQWQASRAPRRLRPWRDYLSWRFSKVFRQYIMTGNRVLEIGCGGSRFLPYFARDLKAEVWGLDYAGAGVATAKSALHRAGVSGMIVQGDLFGTHQIPEGSFDVVFSAGFIEHFTDTQDVVNRIVRFAKPGSGLIITEIPNFGGMNGVLQERADPAFYDQHIVLSPSDIDEAHRESGAQPITRAKYFGTFAPGCVNFSRKLASAPQPLRAVLSRSVGIPQIIVTAPLWMAHIELESATLSPYILGVYKRNEPS